MKYGKVPENVLKRSVLKQIHTGKEEVLNGAGIGEDCAVLACEKDQVITLTVDTLTIPGKKGGKYGIYAAVNDIAATGSEAIGVLLSILLPENIEEPELKEMMIELNALCETLDIQILGGDTRVTRTVNEPVITVTGVGKASKGMYAAASGARPGQDIVISKWIGLEATAMIAEEKREELTKHYSAPFVEQAEEVIKYLSVMKEAATAMKSGVRTMHDVSEGGVYGALWELAESSGVGLEIDLKKIPVRQETIEVCEFVDINPYQSASAGALLMATDSGYDLVRTLEKEGIPAAVIGKITDSNDRVVINEDEVRFLEPPRADEVYGIY